jgi:segregation and condensation protein B
MSDPDAPPVELADAEHVDAAGEPVPELARTVEALLFLSTDPLTAAELAEAAEVGEGAMSAALALLSEQYAPGLRGIQLRELGGGWTLASDPASEPAARRLFSRPRLATLTPAQAETLAIVAYLQPVSRPEITRIRGVSADSASGTLLDRGLIEEAGQSQFGAVLYRTTTQFLKLFGLRDIGELPDVARWDPSPEEQAELRDRLLRAGQARAGGPPGTDEGQATLEEAAERTSDVVHAPDGAGVLAQGAERDEED